jgi:phosphoribosylamine--glycine ligase
VNSAESILFHAGTITKDGKPVTNGGRVLCITSFGDSILKQLKKIKRGIAKYYFTGILSEEDMDTSLNEMICSQL